VRRQAAKGKDVLNQKKQARTNEAKARKLKKIAQKADQKAAKANAQIEALKLGGDAEEIVAIKQGPAKRKRNKQRKPPTVASKLLSTSLANGEEEEEEGAQPPGRKSARVQTSNTAQRRNAKTTTAEPHLSFHGVVGERTRGRMRDAEIAS
jgi:hypothetical protein